MSQSIVQCIMGPGNCYMDTWKGITILLDIEFVHGDIQV